MEQPGSGHHRVRFHREGPLLRLPRHSLLLRPPPLEVQLVGVATSRRETAEAARAHGRVRNGH